MTRTTLAILTVLLFAAVCAFALEGRQSMGVIAGALCGTSVAALGATWQRHTFRYRPKRAFQAVVETFLFKLVFVMLGVLSFRYIDAAAARVEWKTFLVTFVIAAVVIQTVGVFECVRILSSSDKGDKGPSAPSTAKAGPLDAGSMGPVEAGSLE